MELTALEIVNEVQKDLRLPQSPDLTSAHAKLMLSYVNRAQRDIMAVVCDWLALKTYKQFSTVAGTSIYTLPQDVLGVGETQPELTTLSYLELDGNELAKCKTDAAFRAVKSTDMAIPAAYRVRLYNPATGIYTIELNCPADAIYVTTYEGYLRPPVLIEATDVPVLDPETIVIGAILIAKAKQGQDVQFEMEMWRSNFSAMASDNSQGGDMDFL